MNNGDIMSNTLDNMEKLANKLERKMAQEITYPFNPDQDFLALKTKLVLSRASAVAQEVLPDNFKGKVAVAIKVLKDKNFLIISNIAAVPAALNKEFNIKIKEALDNSGPVAKDLVWNWFSFVVGN